MGLMWLEKRKKKLVHIRVDTEFDLRVGGGGGGWAMRSTDWEISERKDHWSRCPRSPAPLGSTMLRTYITE